MPGLAADVDAAEALAAAARVGPYFALEPWAEGAGWRQASLLASDPAVLAGWVTYARAVIAGRAGLAPAAVTERVAGSIVFLGLASRLVSPSLGAAVLGGVVPYLTLDNLWWRPVDGGPWRSGGPARSPGGRSATQRPAVSSTTRPPCCRSAACRAWPIR